MGHRFDDYNYNQGESSTNLLVDFEDPTPDVGRVGVHLVLHSEHLAVLLGPDLLRPEGGEGLKGKVRCAELHIDTDSIAA